MRNPSTLFFSLIFLASCTCTEETRPDLLIPETLTPDLVQKYFNPWDLTGQSYPNEFYSSSRWQSNGPFQVPASIVNYYLPYYYYPYGTPLFYFPYYDPYGRFTIFSYNSFTDCYDIMFVAGLYNQYGYLYYGQYSAGLQLGDILTIYKYAFNDQPDDFGSLSSCKEVQVKTTTFNIHVSNTTTSTSQDFQGDLPSIPPNTYQIISTDYLLTETGYYDISAKVDLNNENEESDENNNEESPGSIIKFYKKGQQEHSFFVQ